MKKLLLYTLFMISVSAYAQTWTYVGSAGAFGSVYPYVALNASGTPYVVYPDPANSGKATVKEYNGSSWVPIGIAGFTDSFAGYTTMAIDAGGTPYIVFSDGSENGKATVMKFNGTSWVTVGAAGFSNAEVYNTNIAIDNSGTPYVAYYDTSLHYCTVKKYDGSNWVTVGSQHFFQGVGILAIDRTGTPYMLTDTVGYTDLTVMKYNGTNWVTVGGAGIAPAAAYEPSIAIDSSGTPYVAYQDEAHSGFVSVMKYNGTSWVNVGVPGFSTGEVGYSLSMNVDKSGTPYVVYTDVANSFKATAMKYNGSSWVVMGSTGFSTGQAEFTSVMQIDNNGNAYVAIQDSFGGSIMKFESTAGVKNIANNNIAVLSVFPDPSQGSFTLNISSLVKEDVKIIITNELGTKVKELITDTNTYTLIQLTEAPGIYFVTAYTAQGEQSRKVVLR